MPADAPVTIAFTTPTDAAALFADLSGAAQEIAAVAYLDPEWRLLGHREFRGTASRAVPSIREIVRDALANEAAAVILAHNHPSGDPTPSIADLAFTRTLARTLAAIDITLADHLILTRTGIASLREAGLL